MGNIKKINGYNLKDEVARGQLNIMTEGYDMVVDEIENLKEEVANIESIIDTGINDTISDRLNIVDTNLANLEIIVANIDKQILTNTEDIEGLKTMIGNASIIPPTYTEPTLSLSISPTYVGHNTMTTIELRPNFVQNDAGNVTKMEVFKDGTKIYNLGNVANYTNTLILAHNTTATYTVTVTYADGPIKQNSMGMDSPTGAIKAGTLTGNISIRAYAPIYYGVITGEFIVGNLMQMLTKVNTSKNTTLSYTLSNSKSVYAYPASFGRLTAIKDDNNFNYINSYTLHEVIYNEINYYVYVMTDEVTIDNFTQIFS